MPKRNHVFWIALPIFLLVFLYAATAEAQPVPAVSGDPATQLALFTTDQELAQDTTYPTNQLAQDTPPLVAAYGPDAPTGEGTYLTYQGRLTDNEGVPVTTSVDIVFKLYDASGTLLYTSDTHTVTPIEGMFTAHIGAPPDPSIGNSILRSVAEIGVTVGSDAEMTPRQSINTVIGSSVNGVGVVGNSQHSYGVYGTSIDSFGVRGESDLVGVFGYSENGLGLVAGSESNSGVTGYTTSISTTRPGVRGINNSTGPGVYGTSEGGIGVHGYTSSTTTSLAGVYGENDGDGAGVYGRSNFVGVFGYSENGLGLVAGSGSNTGVAGYTNSAEISRPGVQGTNHGTGPGVSGLSDAGIGIHAETVTGTAGYLEATGNGQVLYLRNGGASDGSGGGNFIEAVNNDETDVQFRVTTSGTVETDGNYNTPAADFAEMLPAVAGVEPADVLVIGTDGRLTRSTSPYQATVVGVYSTEPGFIGGHEMDGNAADEVPLAIMGVVPVKVSAENGAIQPGDLLVASSTPGHAMRAGFNPPNGTVIGKALGSLTEGTGVIQMLVMLQ